MRWILAGAGALFLGTLYLVWRVAENPHCGIWHSGEPWTFLVVATVVSNATIAFCYFGIPAHFLYFALKLWRSRLPLWLSLLVLVFACFVLWCGLTHLDAVFSRPVVYCTESLVVKIQTAMFSLISLAACAICAEPIVLLLAIVARSKVFAPLLSLNSPAETSDALRRLLEEMDRG